MAGNEFSDQRKHRRYRVKEDAFAWFKGHATRLGQVVDISPAGLTFQYVSDAGPSKGSQELGIFLASNNFHLEGIPSRIISDFDVSELHSLGYVPMRRCGVQFEHLDSHQASQLKHFVEHHAIVKGVIKGVKSAFDSYPFLDCGKLVANNLQTRAGPFTALPFLLSESAGG